jgi:hypothetical protein
MEGVIMDSERFDRIVRSFGQNRSRRQALRTLASVAAGAVALGGAAAVEAGRCKNPKELCGTRKNASCVNKNTDVNNCGSCGNVCTVPNGTTGTTIPACSGGSCTVTCAANWGNCAGTGCDTPLGTPRHCRACGESCLGLADACNDPACDPGSGCFKRPAERRCMGDAGTCNNGFCVAD